MLNYEDCYDSWVMNRCVSVCDVKVLLSAIEGLIKAVDELIPDLSESQYRSVLDPLAKCKALQRRLNHYSYK